MSKAEKSKYEDTPLYFRSLCELELRKRGLADIHDERKRKIESARNSILEFTLLTKPDYQVNWHHKLICKYLDEFSEGKIKRLIINMPPQNGKSELVSRRFPAYILGRNPNIKIVAASNTGKLASQFNREVQRIIDNDTYRLIFPETTLSGTNPKEETFGTFARTSDRFEIVNKTGSYTCIGCMGTITGQPATMLLLDDPFSGASEARSPTMRNNIWEWYNTEFYARRSSEDVGIIIIMTRWHEDDTVGRLLELPEAKEWEVLAIPAICEEPKHPEDPREIGEPLWSEKFSLDDLLKTKRQQGTYQFSALYQQKPQPSEGGLFQRKHFRYYRHVSTGSTNSVSTTSTSSVTDHNVYTLETESGQFRHFHHNDLHFIFTTMDLAVSTGAKSDYTAIGIWGVTKENDLILIDLIRERIEGAEHIELLCSVQSRYKPDIQGVETVQYQLSLYQMAVKRGIPVKALIAKGDKSSRAIPIAAKIEAHKVFLNGEASYLSIVEDELLHFPAGAHDDIVDIFAYAGIFFSENFDEMANLEPLPNYNKISKQFKLEDRLKLYYN